MADLESEIIEADEPAVILVKNKQLAIGILQHPDTNLWQTWFSFYVGDITFLSSHQNRAQAEAVARDFLASWEAGQLASAQSTKDYIAAIVGDAEPEILPPATQFEIGQWIKFGKDDF